MLSATAIHIRSLARVYGVREDELERRATLVTGVMLGSSGAKIIQTAVGRTAAHWATQIIDAVPDAAFSKINGLLGDNFVARYGSEGTIVALNSVAPIAIGAALGAATNLTLAEVAIRSSRRAFGPAPDLWLSESEADRRDEAIPGPDPHAQM